MGETAWRFGYDDILTGFHSKPTVNKAVQHKDGGLEQALRTGELDVMVLASCESKGRTWLDSIHVRNIRWLTG